MTLFGGFSFLFILPFLVASVSGSTCTAICYLNKRQHLACTLKTTPPNPTDFSQPVRCVKKEYGTSTEVVIGKSELVDGLVPGGFDVFSTSEQISSSNPVPIQLTLNVNIKNVGPNVFTKVANLQRLQLHPYDVHACAFYNLPPSVREVLLQCVGPNMKMLAPMRWPPASPVRLKLNMCMQESRCYSCAGSRSVEIRSTVKGPLALNKVVSLTECVVSSSCVTDEKMCDAMATTTTTTSTSTATTTTTTTMTTAKPGTKMATTKPTEAAAKTEKRQSGRAAPTSTGSASEERELRVAENRLLRGEKREHFLLLAVAGATVLNSLLLLTVLVVLFYAASCCCCCRKKPRGVFFISKENYPPEYSTLRPV